MPADDDLPPAKNCFGAVGHRRRAESTSVLITDDIFSLTRNPMYLGIALMLLGTAIGSGGLFFYIATLLFFLIIDRVFCPYEETKLAHAFSDEFRRYWNRVRRWL